MRCDRMFELLLSVAVILLSLFVHLFIWGGSNQHDPVATTTTDDDENHTGDYLQGITFLLRFRDPSAFLPENICSDFGMARNNTNF